MPVRTGREKDKEGYTGDDRRNRGRFRNQPGDLGAFKYCDDCGGHRLEYNGDCNHSSCYYYYYFSSYRYDDCTHDVIPV